MEAAVFDIDGTLVDSMEFWDNLSKNYLISQGVIPDDGLDMVLNNLTVEEGIIYIIKQYKLNKSHIQIRDELDQLLSLYYKHTAKLKPFVVELIKLLKGKNIRLAIASLTDEKFIYSVLTRYDIDKHFEFIQTCDNTGLVKDNEDFFKLLSKRLKVSPKNIFLFEDSLYSMEAAKRVGLNIVAVEDNYSKKDIEKIIKVSDIYIKNFGYILPFLK